MSIRRLAFPVLALFLATACGGGGDRQNLTGPSEPSPDPQASSITISPSSATLNALEDTASFSATVRDQNGNTMSGVSVSWSSANPSVATVDGSGDAVAQAIGMAGIIAQAEGVADSASVTVEQQPAQISVSPVADTVPAGDEVQFSAEVEDANGHAIADADFSWSSSDSAIATVDTAGATTGHFPGEANIVASTNGEADTARIVVTDPLGNQAPSASIEEPSSGDGFDNGATVTFRGTADDIEDGDLTGSALEWRSNIDGEFGTGTELMISSLSAGEHEITLTATDTEGASGADTVGITVRQPANLALVFLAVIRRGVLTSETPTARAFVQNAGESHAEGFTWEMFINGNLVVRGGVSGLAAGEMIPLPEQTLPNLPAGFHQVDVELDVFDDVEESNESDNSGFQRIVSYTSGFQIELDFLSSVSDTIRQAFDDASVRWAEVITSDLPDVVFSSPQSFEFCAEGAGTRTETIDDLLIFVRVDSIDGPGGTLGQAGPCTGRVDPFTGRFVTASSGAMTFDEADLEQLAQDGGLEATILHEMGHVLGIGVLWPEHNLVFGTSTDDPFYFGAAGLTGFFEVGGDQYDGQPVPVANTGGEGTRNVHWRESVFDIELMTGFLNGSSSPLSIVTVQSLGDQFYAVDTSAADSYSLPLGSSLRLKGADGIDLGNDIRQGPIRGLTEDGQFIDLLDGLPFTEWRGVSWLNSQTLLRLIEQQWRTP